MSNIYAWQVLKEKRDARLVASDWTQITDNQLSDSKKTEWQTYRQALRVIPNNLRGHSKYVSDENSNPFDGSIMSWGWPTKPS